MFTLEIQDKILNKLSTLIVVLNNDGNIDFVSKSAQSILGYEPNDLLGLNWWDKTRFTKTEGEEIKTKLLLAFKFSNAEVQHFEHELKTAIGGKKWIRWNVSRLNEESLVGIGYDITETKLKEKRLLENNKLLSEKNKDITDSIQYAQRIQESILQKSSVLENMFNDAFVLYKPKDIVSGDYYWFYEDLKYKYVAIADCTGHGVPGAMMSMLANSIMKEVFINQKLTSPSAILYAIDFELNKALNQNNEAVFKDGMDVALVRIDKQTNELVFAGAFRPILIATKDGITEIKGSRYPIGFYSGVEKEFIETNLILNANDAVYLFTDGFVDQFGGDKNKKLNRKNFTELLSSVREMPMIEQEAFLDYSFNNWKQDYPQTDDILVVGIKI